MRFLSPVMTSTECKWFLFRRFGSSVVNLGDSNNGDNGGQGDDGRDGNSGGSGIGGGRGGYNGEHDVCTDVSSTNCFRGSTIERVFFSTLLLRLSSQPLRPNTFPYSFAGFSNLFFRLDVLFLCCVLMLSNSDSSIFVRRIDRPTSRDL